MSDEPQYVPVMVRWLDACRRDEVEDGDDLGPLEAVTFGHLLADEEGFVAVAHECFTRGDYRDVTTIPRGMVVELVRLVIGSAEPELLRSFVMSDGSVIAATWTE